MCRLLGWAAATRCSAADLLDGHLTGFADLSERHADGWGAAFARGGDPEVVKEPVAARTSPVFESAMHKPAPAAMVHLRWATGGLPVLPVNTHPFVRDGLAFAHNGHVQDMQRIESLIDVAVVGEPLGDTDSERYFLAVLTQLRRGARPAEALASVATSLSGSPSTSLNCLLVTPEQLVAVCRHDPALLPPHEVPDYFHLGAERVIGADGATRAVLIGSSGVLPDAGEPVPALSSGPLDASWIAGRRTIPNGFALIVDRAYLRTELVALDV
ncbi:MAG TPA: class II glutamine amidotransferase [Frankiaceae bacterium]|nr:class II glutamine amidotransferase [Frankiaceae bacterium]